MSRAGARRPPATLGHLRRTVQAAIAKVGRGFQTPEADWQPMLFVQSPKGLETFALPALMAAAGSGARKEAVAAVLKELLAACGAYRYALLLNVFAIGEPNEEQVEAMREETMRISAMPGSFECLHLIVGDAESEEHWEADILRDGRGLRTLGPWEVWDSAEGRFTDLGEVLRRPR